jgi:hypothetical protein
MPDTPLDSLRTALAADLTALRDAVRAALAAHPFAAGLAAFAAGALVTALIA